MGDLSLENMNLSTVHTDPSKWSDNEAPSLSIDDDGLNDKEFYLKEHTNKLDILRKENFDLKLKLYLLETDANFSNDKGKFDHFFFIFKVSTLYQNCF